MDTNINHLETTGSWTAVQIASVDEILTCPRIISPTNAHKIEISGDANTINFLPFIENISISSVPQRQKSGIIYKTKATIEIETVGPEINAYLLKYLQKKVIIIGKDDNNYEMIYGSKSQPLFFTFQESRGKAKEMGAKTIVEIYGDITQKPIYVKV